MLVVQCNARLVKFNEYSRFISLLLLFFIPYLFIYLFIALGSYYSLLLLSLLVFDGH